MPISVSNIQGATSAQLLKLTKSRHPEFADNVDHWKFMESCYNGGRSWFDDNIFTYVKEGATEFEQRKKRAYRFPHSREVVSLINKYVFKGSIERTDDKELPAHIKQFWNASTLLKRPIQSFMDTISLWTSTFGRVWIIVDSNLPADAVTVKDAKEAKGRAYAYYLKPYHAFDFAYDEDGELDWFLHGQFSRDDQNPLTSSGVVGQDFRIWTKEFSAVIQVTKDSDGTEIAKLKGEPSIHNLGLVPVFPADHLLSEELYSSQALIDDVAYQDRAVANYLSNLDVIIQDQTFSQLAIPFQGLLADTTADADDDDGGLSQIQVMGTKRVFAYNAEGGAAPTFISPDVKQAGMILSVVTKIVGEIYHSIGMAGERTKEDNATGIDNSSGVAKAYDFERLNAMLAAKARSLQSIEKNLVRIVNAWNGTVAELEDTADYVSYPTTFDVRNLSDEMDNAQRLSVQSAPKTIRRRQMKRLAEKMFPQISDKDMKQIESDIDNDWLQDIETSLTAGLPTPGKSGDANSPSKGRVPGKKNSRGENNKGSVKADDK